MGIIGSSWHRGKSRTGRKVKKKSRSKKGGTIKRKARGVVENIPYASNVLGIYDALTEQGIPPSQARAMASMGKKKKGGLSKKEISGFYKVARLIRKVGYKPKIAKSRRY